MSTQAADASAGVAFLTSLLLRFPAIGSASLGPKPGEVRLEFYLEQEIDPQRFQQFVEKFRLSWDLFFELLRIQPGERRFSRVVDYPGELPEQEADVEIVRVVRDLETFTFEELSMVVGLIKERFVGVLIEADAIESPELGYQERVLRQSLDKIRNSPGSQGALTGFRDDLRVLVYSGDDPSKEPSIGSGRLGEEAR